MRRLLTIIFFVLLHFTGLKAQDVAAKLDAYFTAQSANHAFNGTVLVADKGKIVYHKAFGFADFKQGRQNTTVSVFPIASISKLFTATAILQLQQRGLLSVNDPVQKYLPEFPYPSVCISHLLSHSSGIRPFDDFFETLRKAHPDTVFENKDILPRFANLHLPLLFSAGQEVGYNNVNYIFLALIIEKLTGMPYAQYIKKFIFKPTGMGSRILPLYNHYVVKPLEMMDLVRLHVGHWYSDEVELADTMKSTYARLHAYQFLGYGEIVSSAADLFKFDQALRRGTLLKPATLESAYIPVNLTDGKPNTDGLGLGWKVEFDPLFGKIVGHGGGLVGLSSALWRLYDKDQVIILLDNTQQNVEQIEMDALNILNGIEVKPVLNSIAREYAKTLLLEGDAVAVGKVATLMKDNLHYSLIEKDFNRVGYDFLRSGLNAQALSAFKLNTEMFPESWNTYDSYAEALLQNGHKADAITMYQKSVELNPGNENGKRILKELKNGQ